MAGVTIGLICAIPQELAHLRAILADAHSTEAAHTVFDTGTIDGHEVVLAGSVTMHVTYEEGRGVMSRLLQACDRREWQLTDLAADAAGEHVGAGSGGVMLTLSGRGILAAPTVLAGIDGVTAIRQLDDEPD